MVHHLRQLLNRMFPSLAILFRLRAAQKFPPDIACSAPQESPTTPQLPLPAEFPREPLADGKQNIYDYRSKQHQCQHHKLIQQEQQAAKNLKAEDNHPVVGGENRTSELGS
jgi:hypothetical protein